MPGVEEIVVTAQRREESLNEVPLAISTFSGEELREFGISDTRDLGRIVPGFRVSDSGYSVPVYSLRGVGFNDISYSGTGTVGIYADEAPYAFAVMTKGATLDVERVEVVKGPVGTLYGRNATGGAVNYIANKPTDEFEAGISGSYGRFHLVEGSGFVSGPLLDSLSGRLAIAGAWSADGWQVSNTRPDDRLGKQNEQSGRGTLDWKPTDDLLVRLTLSGWMDDGESQAPYALELRPQNPVAPQFVDPAVADYPYIPDNDDPRRADWPPVKDWQLNEQFWNAAARAEWQARENLELATLLSFARFTADGSLVPQSGIDVLSADQENDATLNALAAETRLAGDFGPRIDWLAGVSVAHDETEEQHTVFTDKNSFNFGPPVTGNPTGLPLLFSKGTFVSTNDANSYGGFASATWAFLETLKLTQGIRYTREDRSFESCSMESADSEGFIGLSALLNALSLAKGGPGGIEKGECFNQDAGGNPGVFEDELDEDNVATRTVLDWTPLEDVLLFASYTRGYKSGGFPQLFATDNSTLAPATQELLVDYEVGAKASAWEGRMHAELGGFYYDYDDKQLLTYTRDPIFGPLPVFRNAPKSRVVGGEIAMSLVPVEGAFVSGAAAYIDTEILEFEGTTANGTAFDFAGRPFNYAPKVQATTMAHYTVPVADPYRLTAGVDVSYASSTNATLEGDPTFAIAGYVLLGARLRFFPSDGPWSVGLFGRNLTNELYKTGVFRAGDVIAASTGYPRTFGVTFDYRFDMR